MNLAAVPTSLFVVTALLFLEGTARNILTTNYRKVAINGPVCGSLVASCRHGAIIKNGPMWAVRVKTPPSLIKCFARRDKKVLVLHSLHNTTRLSGTQILVNVCCIFTASVSTGCFK